MLLPNIAALKFLTPYNSNETLIASFPLQLFMASPTARSAQIYSHYFQIQSDPLLGLKTCMTKREVARERWFGTTSRTLKSKEMRFRNPNGQQDSLSMTLSYMRENLGVLVLLLPTTINVVINILLIFQQWR